MNKRFIVAPNAFKGSLSAGGVADAVALGLETRLGSVDILKVPIADGGDGTMQLLTQILNGKEETVSTVDPLGRSMVASIGVDETRSTAILDMAAASGITLLDEKELDPFKASSFGTGLLIDHALQRGLDNIILGLGGTATVDGGLGILKALGFKILNKEKEETTDLVTVRSIVQPEADQFMRLKKVRFVILTDVTNYLLGEEGAAKVFGPQKGADAKGVEQLERGLFNLRNVVSKQYDFDLNTIEGGGAAGGTGAMLSFFLNATLRSGAKYMIEATGLNDRLRVGDIVITGEGRLDSQTAFGKGAAVIASIAKAKGCRVVGLAGEIAEDFDLQRNRNFDAVFSIQQGAATLNEALALTEKNIVKTVTQLASLL